MALGFNGSTQRVVTANQTGAPTVVPLTVCAVIRVTNFADYGCIFSCGRDTQNGYECVLKQTTGEMQVYNHADPADSGQAVPTAAWIFVGWSLTSSTSRRYYCYNYETRAVVFDVTSTVSYAITAPVGQTCKMGMDEDGAGSYWDPLNGQIAWVAVYDTDFTSDALLATAFLGPLVFRTPSLLYDFLEGTGTSTAERMGTGNTGTLANSPTWNPMSLPGPWWEGGAPKVKSFVAAAAADELLNSRRMIAQP